MDCIYNKIYIYINARAHTRDRGFCSEFFTIPIILLNKHAYNNIISLVLLKNIRVYIIFVILLVKDEHSCYNEKVTHIYTYNFNCNRNLIKNIAYNLHALTQ